MADGLRSRLIRIAADLPVGSSERKALLNVLAEDGASKLASDIRRTLAKMKDGTKVSFSAGGEDPRHAPHGVHIHVWFDNDVARTDFGARVPDSGEWQVIVSTSPDPLNLSPRGKELARQYFRYADPKMRNGVLGMAEDYIRNRMARYR